MDILPASTLTSPGEPEPEPGPTVLGSGGPRPGQRAHAAAHTPALRMVAGPAGRRGRRLSRGPAARPSMTPGSACGFPVDGGADDASRLAVVDVAVERGHLLVGDSVRDDLAPGHGPQGHCLQRRLPVGAITVVTREDHPQPPVVRLQEFEGDLPVSVISLPDETAKGPAQPDTHIDAVVPPGRLKDEVCAIAVTDARHQVRHLVECQVWFWRERCGGPES